MCAYCRSRATHHGDETASEQVNRLTAALSGTRVRLASAYRRTSEALRRSAAAHQSAANFTDRVGDHRQAQNLRHAAASDDYTAEGYAEEAERTLASTIERRTPKFTLFASGGRVSHTNLFRASPQSWSPCPSARGGSSVVLAHGRTQRLVPHPEKNCGAARSRRTRS